MYAGVGRTKLGRVVATVAELIDRYELTTFGVSVRLDALLSW